MPAAVEVSHFGPRLSSLVGLLLGSAFPLSVSKTQALLPYLLGVDMSRGEIATIRLRLRAALAEPMAQALEAARQQPVAYVVDEVFREAVGNQPQTTGPRCLAVPGAGLDCPSPWRSDAVTVAGSLNQLSGDAASLLAW